jgi:hypothetical protein
MDGGSMIVLYIDPRAQGNEFYEWQIENDVHSFGYVSVPNKGIVVERVQVGFSIWRITFRRDADGIMFKMKFSDAIAAADEYMTEMSQMVRQYEDDKRANKREDVYSYDRF